MWRFIPFGNPGPSYYVTKQEFREILVNAGADINDPGWSGLPPPITLSIIYRDLNMCKLLVSLGADLTCSYLKHYERSSHYSESALHRAIDAESALYKAIHAGPEYVTYLLEQGAELPNQEANAWYCKPFYRETVCATPDILNAFLDGYKRMDRQLPWILLINFAFRYEMEDPIVAILQREYHLWVENNSRYIKAIFKVAVNEQFTKVMHLLIEQQPQIVHEAWMLEIQVKETLDATKHKEFLSLFDSLRSQPLTLQLICKTQILRQLGPNSEPLINQLELPHILKDYLKTKNAL
jgi:hypothetical protein